MTNLAKNDSPDESSEQTEDKDDVKGIATQEARQGAAMSERERLRHTTEEWPAVDQIDGKKASGTGRTTTEELHKVEIVDPDKSSEKPKEVDTIELEKAADAIDRAGNGGLTGAGTDKALNLLTSKGGHTDDAGRIHTALIQRGQWVEGRSDENCEKDIRDTVATMNSKQIETMAREYEELYGVTLRDALINDPNLSTATKESLEIFLKGTDQRTADDTLKLADIALKQQDLHMFQEAMRDASPLARKRFMQERGKEYIQEAFRGLTESTHALEYAETGRLGTATKNCDNTSWAGDNERATKGK